MKRNLMSIVILALLVVNLAMNGFILFSLMSSNSKSAKLIADISAAMELESAGGTGGGVDPTKINVAVEDSVPYSLTGGTAMNIALAVGEDGRQHYLQLEVTLQMDSKNEAYATYGTTDALANQHDYLVTIVQNIIRQYTIDEVSAAEAQIKKDILTEIWELYGGAAFIYRVDFPTFLPA